MLRHGGTVRVRAEELPGLTDARRAGAVARRPRGGTRHRDRDRRIQLPRTDRAEHEQARGPRRGSACGTNLEKSGSVRLQADRSEKREQVEMDQTDIVETN